MKEPDWRDAPCGGEYHPSANIPPTSYTPVLLLQSPTEGEEEEARVIQPMMWGLIPPWHHGEDPKGSGLSPEPDFPPKFASRQNMANL
jgi:putative SOS response-associated peptidase YedK